ncbi:unnamed protein product, partial [Tetraodon nigroviridis]
MWRGYAGSRAHGGTGVSVAVRSPSLPSQISASNQQVAAPDEGHPPLRRGLKGERGSPGNSGQKGESGVKGDTGPAGPPGAKGDQV